MPPCLVLASSDWFRTLGRAGSKELVGAATSVIRGVWWAAQGTEGPPGTPPAVGIQGVTTIQNPWLGHQTAEPVGVQARELRPLSQV